MSGEEKIDFINFNNKIKPDLAIPETSLIAVCFACFARFSHEDI